MLHCLLAFCPKACRPKTEWHWPALKLEKAHILLHNPPNKHNQTKYSVQAKHLGSPLSHRKWKTLSTSFFPWNFPRKEVWPGIIWKWVYQIILWVLRNVPSKEWMASEFLTSAFWSMSILPSIEFRLVPQFLLKIQSWARGSRDLRITWQGQCWGYEGSLDEEEVLRGFKRDEFWKIQLRWTG